jgi:hypothetical protein
MSRRDSRTSVVIPEEDTFYAVSLLHFNKPFPKGPPISFFLDQNNAIIEGCKENCIPVKQDPARHETEAEREKHFG